MPLAYSKDLRWRIVWLYHYKNKSIKEIEFVSSRSVRRFLDLFDSFGDVFPSMQQHGPQRKLDAFEEMTLIQSLLNKPDMYLDFRLLVLVLVLAQ